MVGECECGAVGGRNLKKKALSACQSTVLGQRSTVYPQNIESLIVTQPVHTPYFYFNCFNHTRLVIYER